MADNLDNDTAANMVQELLASDRGMTGWEMDFIEDMNRLTAYSPKQAAKVEDIWQRVFG